MSERYRLHQPNHLEAIIATQGRTKKWVAERGGLTASGLDHVIAGRRTISGESAQRVADVLGMPFYLLFESASADKTSPEAVEAALLGAAS